MENKLLRVGPQSAGAVPGPACYGRGGKSATVTDAALVLGYLDTTNFLGGEMDVAGDLAREALRTNICAPLGISEEEAARSIFDVLVSRTSSSIKEMLLERGLDPRDFSLLAFGGCGPLIGPMIQRELEMPELLVPPLPSVFSAWGMMASDLSFSESVSVLEPISAAAVEVLRQKAGALAEMSVAELRRRVGTQVDPKFRYFTRVRFIGQEHTLSVEYFLEDTHETLFQRFSDTHHDRFGHSFDEPAEMVSLSIRLTIVTPKPEISASLLHGQETGPQVAEIFDLAAEKFRKVPYMRRSELDPHRVHPGPLLVVDEGSSLAIHGDQRLVVEANGIITISLGRNA